MYDAACNGMLLSLRFNPLSLLIVQIKVATVSPNLFPDCHNVTGGLAIGMSVNASLSQKPNVQTALQILVHVVCGRGSVLLRRRCNTIQYNQKFVRVAKIA